jgi:hypothetical protein
VSRGEKPIESRDSWFSAKSIEVERHFSPAGVELFVKAGGLTASIAGIKTAKTVGVMSGSQSLGVKVLAREGNSPD